MTERRRLEWVTETRLRQPERALAAWLEREKERLELLGDDRRDLVNRLLELLRDPQQLLLELLELLLLHVLQLLQGLQLLGQDLEQLNRLLREWRL
jgi:hypothetical protein